MEHTHSSSHDANAAGSPSVAPTIDTAGDSGLPDAAAVVGTEHPAPGPGVATEPGSIDTDEPASAAAEASVTPDILGALTALEEQVRRFHERAARHEEIIREMQSRITSLQGDQVQALLKPTLQRFASLHAQALEAGDAAKERGERASNDFAYFAAAIEDALGLIDLDSVDAKVGGTFDPRAHHATSTVATDDPALDKTVHRVTRQGFGYTDATRVAIPAQVVVYRYDESLVTATTESTAPVDGSATPTPTDQPDQSDSKETLA